MAAKTEFTVLSDTATVTGGPEVSWHSLRQFCDRVYASFAVRQKNVSVDERQHLQSSENISTVTLKFN
jgi:hypothetical protein